MSVREAADTACRAAIAAVASAVEVGGFGFTDSDLGLSKKMNRIQIQIRAKKQIHNPTQPINNIESKPESKSIRFYRFEIRPNP